MAVRDRSASQKADAAGVGAGGEELGDGRAERRVAERRGDLGERDEDEAAVGEARMRDDEIACADDGGGVEEDVNVEGAWAFVEAQAAAEAVLD
mgnify:CR=1 FL=1